MPIVIFYSFIYIINSSLVLYKIKNSTIQQYKYLLNIRATQCLTTNTKYCSGKCVRRILHRFRVRFLLVLQNLFCISMVYVRCMVDCRIAGVWCKRSVHGLKLQDALLVQCIYTVCIFTSQSQEVKNTPLIGIGAVRMDYISVSVVYDYTGTKPNLKYLSTIAGT